MNKMTVRLIIVLALALGCAPLPAQEDERPAPKKPAPKALLEAKARYREKKAQEKAKAAAEAKAKEVDVNHASLEDLKKIPGITDAYAAAIIAKRPYKSKAELVTKNALPRGVYQMVRKWVAAK